MTAAASLGMYDAPWLQAENDRFWTALRDRLALSEAPEHLDRDRPLDAILHDPALLLGHTCGYPLMTRLRAVVRVVATPVYDLPGCDGPRHGSFVVVRHDDPAQGLSDLRGRVVAVNGVDSNSGMNLLRAAIAPLAEAGRFFGRVTLTGAHLASLQAVRDGVADTAAIDCVTHGLAALHRPDLLVGTRILATTPRSPNLPLVTAASTPDSVVARLRAALVGTLPWPALAWSSVAILDVAAYEVVIALEHDAADAGYPELR